MNAKKKGNKGENAFANWLQTHGIKAYKNSSSGGNEWKSDIHNDLGLNLEVKTCKRINLLECWKQTDRDSSLAKTEPVLAIHFDGMPEGEWLIVQHSEDWVEGLKTRSQTPHNALQQDFTPQADRTLKYEMDKLRAQISKVSKLLN